MCLEVCPGRIEVGDAQREVLTLGRNEVGNFKEMNLLIAGLQPRAVEGEVRPVIALRHPQHVDIEPRGDGSIGHVERNMVDSGVEHGQTLRQPSGSVDPVMEGMEGRDGGKDGGKGWSDGGIERNREGVETREARVIVYDREMATSPATSVDGYLAELPPERAAVVAEVRQLVLNALPDGVEESMHFGLIAYEIPLERYPETYNGQPLMFAALAAQKHHYSLYLHGMYASGSVEQELRTAYAEADTKLDMGKSCLRFKRLDQLVPVAIATAIGAVSVDDYIELYEARRQR